MSRFIGMYKFFKIFPNHLLLLQPASSVPSEQSFTPLQSNSGSTHSLLSHSYKSELPLHQSSPPVCIIRKKTLNIVILNNRCIKQIRMNHSSEKVCMKDLPQFASSLPSPQSSTSSQTFDHGRQFLLFQQVNS